MTSWTKVLECFHASHAKQIYTTDPEQEYWYFKTLYSGMNADDNTALYLVHWEDIPDISFSGNVAVIILTNSESALSGCPNIISGNSLILPACDLTTQGLIALDEEFRRQFKVGYVLQQLLEIVSGNGGIQNVIETISAFFQEPIALLDTTFRYIARSETYKPISGKSIFSDDAHYGVGFNRTMLEYFRKRGLLDKLMYTHTPFSFNLDHEEHAYFVPVIVNKLKVAYLIIYSNKPEANAEEFYMNYLPLFSQMISIELAKRNFYLFNKGTYFNYIFSLILSEENVDVEDIRMRLHIYNYELRENMYLIEVDTRQDADQQTHKNQIAESIRNTFRNSFYTLHENRIFFLISRFDNELLTEEEIESWDMSLKSQNLVAAITGPFTGFSDIHKHIREVRMLLDAMLETNENRNIYTFSEYQTKAMINYLKKEDIGLFLYKPVLALVEYDELHSTELVVTLKEYLQHPKEITAICNTLCIHKNTLYKRLEKIDSLMNCDIRNGHEIMKIELTLDLLGR